MSGTAPGQAPPGPDGAAAMGPRGRRAGGPFLRVYAFILLGFAAALALPGLYLVWLGGSPYYALAGAVVALAAACLLRGAARAGKLIYLAFLAATIAWAIWEAGLYGWALLPRLNLPLLFGLPLLLSGPRVHRRLTRPAIAAMALLVAAHMTSDAPLGARERAIGSSPPNGGDWAHYGATQAGERFSALDEVNVGNADRLEAKWTARIGMASAGGTGTFEATPLAVDGRLFICGSRNDVIALDGDTGRQLWRWNSRADTTGVEHQVCRGVAYYRTPDAKGPCAERIYTATIDARLVALDALTGQPCAAFGRAGSVDLWVGFGKVEKGYYFVTSPPAVVRGKLVLGGWVTDNQYVGEPSGVIRAFDAVTGKLSWAWDLGRVDGDVSRDGETYARGTPNSWAPMSADEALGLVYVPTGNATPDYVGAHRSPQSEKYASSVVALDATSGKPRWSFQTTHHDIWDYDVASQPTLIDIPASDGVVPALLLPTKRGELFLLDRRTGASLSTVAEQPVPADTAPGEWASPTQPFSTGMPSFAGPPLTEERMWGISAFDQLYCRIAFRQSRYRGPMTPLGLQWTIVYPGYIGGMNWGGVSVNPQRLIAVATATRLAMRNRLLTRAEVVRLGLSAAKPGQPPQYAGNAQEGAAYGSQISFFFSPLGIPCQQPPFGVIGAVDLQSRTLLWEKPLGTAEASGPLGLRSMLPLTIGTPLVGGSITTAGGLILVAATQDGKLRALDMTSGRELWSTVLPAGGQATPMTFRSPRSGRQFIVICAGGNKNFATPAGDYVIAYGLPETAAKQPAS
jgi:quinoprotein glucose dehydrogenase